VNNSLSETSKLSKLLSEPAALIVIDIQNDYIHPAGALGRSGKELQYVHAMMPRLHQLIEDARRNRVPIYFARNWQDRNTDSAAWRSRTAGRSYDPTAVAGTWGAEWFEITPKANEIVVDKYRYDAFLGTPLELMLRAGKIETVVCCGTATNVCVESTARAAFMRDFNLILVADCCAATDRNLHDATLTNIKRHFGLVASASEVTAAWKAGSLTAG
jgi:ureidoacrylate peracid hydrolase